MNVLSFDKQTSAIAALTEGCSIRATERLTGVHRDTIMRLGVRVGEGCLRLHDRMMRDLQVQKLELDELWAYVGMKQRRAGAHPEKGDQYTYLALDAINNAIIAHETGKRNAATTQRFVNDVAERIINRPQISSDTYQPYVSAIEDAFINPQYGQVIKHYRAVQSPQAARRYSPGEIVSVETKDVFGSQRDICTSHIERANLTVRMQSRRFTRLTSGFSKRIENHKAAVSLFVSHYNLCRVHETLRITPAMAIGVTDHIWSIGELMEAASSDAPHEPPAGRRVGPFRVIDGGVS